MEREEGFTGYPNKITRASTALTVHPRHHSVAATAINVENNNLNEQQPIPQPPLPPACIIREQDQYLPIANVIRIMRRIIPPNAKISDDAKETVQECVSEYISFVTGEANERCHREQRKTVNAEDVIWAMGKLGFDNYVEPLSLFLSRYRESESEHTSSHKEPLLRSGVVDCSPLGMAGPFGPVFNMTSQERFYDPSTSGSVSGAGSSTQGYLPGFAPLAPFK